MQILDRTVRARACASVAYVMLLCSSTGATGLAEKKAALPAEAGTILGSVWDAQNHGVPGALVRLRNLTTGRIEAGGRSDDLGRFTFENIEGGKYVIEVVNIEGHVLALGRHFTVAPGETIATFVRLGARLPWFSGFFANAAATAVASAASLGVTAITPGQQPVSPAR